MIGRFESLAKRSGVTKPSYRAAGNRSGSSINSNPTTSRNKIRPSFSTRILTEDKATNVVSKLVKQHQNKVEQ